MFLHHRVPRPSEPMLCRQHACGEAMRLHAGAQALKRPFWSCRVRAASAKASKAPGKSAVAAGSVPATPKQPALSPLGQPLVSKSPASELGQRRSHARSLIGSAESAYCWVRLPDGGRQGC